MPQHPNVKKSIILICPALIILSVGPYYRLWYCDFITYDDPVYVTDNPQVSNGLTVAGIRYAFTTTDTANYHPLTWLSLMLDDQLFGLNPRGFHFTNLFFHLLNTLVLFLLLNRMTKAHWCSAMVAALFALHPLHVESVAWISERKDVLSTFFWLLTTWAYVRYAYQPGLIRYLLIIVFFILGLLAKPMLVTLPFALLLMDYWPLKRFGGDLDRVPTAKKSKNDRIKSDPALHYYKKSSFPTLIIEKLPLFILTMVFCTITFLVQQNKGAVQNIEHLGIIFRMTNAAISYCIYMGKMFFPIHLGLFYPYPESLPPTWQWIGALIILISISMPALMIKKRPYLLVGWLWFLGALVPVIGLVQVGDQARADRYTYIPLIGLFIALVWGFADLTASWRRRKNISIITAVVILAALTGCTWRQIGFWQNSITLFEHSLEIDDRNYLAHNQLGWVWAEQGNYDKAIEHHRTALQIKPGYTKALVNLGRELYAKQMYAEAISSYRQALKNNPQNAIAHSGLGAALMSQSLLEKSNDFTEAENAFRTALEIDPGYDSAHLNLAQLLAYQLKFDEAIAQCRELLRISPNDNRARNLLKELRIRKNQNIKHNSADSMNLGPHSVMSSDL